MDADKATVTITLVMNVPLGGPQYTDILSGITQLVADVDDAGGSTDLHGNLGGIDAILDWCEQRINDLTDEDGNTDDLKAALYTQLANARKSNALLRAIQERRKRD